MKTFGWIVLILEFLGYTFRNNITDKPLEIAGVLVDCAFIISATALIIAGNFKRKDKTE